MMCRLLQQMPEDRILKLKSIILTRQFLLRWRISLLMNQPNHRANSNIYGFSTNTPTSWAWVFTPATVTYVGGTNASSQHPQVQFNAAGSYDVELTATNGSGSDTETKSNYINVSIPAPVADFSADNTTPETTETVNFTDLSTNSPTSWAWVFTPDTITYMNGTNASSQHPKVQV